MSFASGVDTSVLVPSLKYPDEVRGRPPEFRFRSLEVGAEADWVIVGGVAAISCRDCNS